MKSTIFLILLLSFFSSCEETHHQLGSGLEIAFSDPASTTNISAFVIRDTSGTIIISAFVLGIDFDSKFVIVEQEPKELLWSDSLINKLSLTVLNSIVDTSSLRHYWIIDKSIERVFYDNCDSVPGVYGPFSKDSFSIKRKALGVPDSLFFQDIRLCKRYGQYGLD